MKYLVVQMMEIARIRWESKPNIRVDSCLSWRIMQYYTFLIVIRYSFIPIIFCSESTNNNSIGIELFRFTIWHIRKWFLFAQISEHANKIYIRIIIFNYAHEHWTQIGGNIGATCYITMKIECSNKSYTWCRIIQNKISLWTIRMWYLVSFHFVLFIIIISSLNMFHSILFELLLIKFAAILTNIYSTTYYCFLIECIQSSYILHKFGKIVKSSARINDQIRKWFIWQKIMLIHRLHYERCLLYSDLSIL